VASIGSLRMAGVAKNLDAHLEAQCQEAAFDTITTETEAPLAIAVGLLVRERLTGRPLPPSAENVVRHWREYIDDRAGDDIEALRDTVFDQDQFARRCRAVLADMGFAPELDEPPELDDSDQETETVDESAESDSELSPEDVALDEDAMADEDSDGESSVVQMEADMDLTDLGADSEPDDAPNLMADEQGASKSM
ncbi:MAG: cobaltochelatase subunit CobT, partial [Gammaproteobacteria bacterium]|nr:cobaltochelatase subunit CobT [Gammaproteobacteria bacterium]